MTCFAEKVVLVTGSAQGIGFSIARSFAQKGAHVLLLDKDEAAVHHARNLLTEEGHKADCLVGDLSATGGVSTLICKAIHLGGKLDVLINNAKSGRRLSFLDESEDNWAETCDVILKSAFFLSQEFVRHRKSAEGGGSILNIASVAANLVTNESPSYHVAKAGLQQLTRYLAVSAAQSNIRVNTILPGLIVQERHKNRFEDEQNASYRGLTSIYQPMGQVGSELDVAEAALFLCSDQAKYISGACLVVDGGATIQEQFGMLLRLKSCQ